MTEDSKEYYEFLNGSIKLITKLVNDYTDTLISLYRAERDETDRLHKALKELKEKRA